MERVTVIVATFGSDDWEAAGDDAMRRLIESGGAASNAGRVHVVRSHERTLVEARNAAAYTAAAGWLCFLDADDDLEPGYLDALLAGSGDLRAPAIRYDDADPVVLADRCIDGINPCVIGTLIRRELFIDAGGFWHERAWEDWSLFRRAWLLGAEIVHHPDAVYRVNTRPDSRNNTVRRPRELHRSIRAAHQAWMETR